MSGRIEEKKMIEPHTKDEKHQYICCVKTRNLLHRHYIIEEKILAEVNGIDR